MRRAPENIWDFLSPIVEGMDYTFVGATLGQGESGLTLRVYIDKDATDEDEGIGETGPNRSGVVVEDCVAVSRQVSAALDVEDLIAGEYTLEVSSPGVDRPLFTATDYEEQIGNTVKFKLGITASGRRNYKGVVDRVEEGLVVVEVDNELHELAMQDIESANLVTAVNSRRSSQGNNQGNRKRR